MKKNTAKTLSSEVLEKADGVFGTVIDLSLWYIAYFASLGIPQKQSGAYWQAQRNADSFLELVHYDVIKRGIIEARRRGFVEKKRSDTGDVQISPSGVKRLQSVTPLYKEMRPWDGKMYLVTYDIPEKQRRDRVILCRYLTRIKCARLQDSLWLTLDNPKAELWAFVKEHELGGMIIVSDVGRDGSIGDEDIHTLIIRVFNIEKLNKRYIIWLNRAEREATPQLSLLGFLSILKDDPQLPFELLPSWWKGNEAYAMVKRQLRSMSMYCRSAAS